MKPFEIINVININLKTEKMSIDEQNDLIIKSRFGGSDVRVMNCDCNLPPRLNLALLESVKDHRRINGLTSKIAILRNYLRTRKFVRTTVC